MARPRSFDEGAVIAAAGELFARRGYFATSIDDLVAVTRLQRGSLYKAFGSKRNLFELSLRTLLLEFGAKPEELDLLTVALKEVAPEDSVVAQICDLIAQQFSGDLAGLLGRNLVNKLKG